MATGALALALAQFGLAVPVYALAVWGLGLWWLAFGLLILPETLLAVNRRV